MKYLFLASAIALSVASALHLELSARLISSIANYDKDFLDSFLLKDWETENTGYQLSTDVASLRIESSASGTPNEAVFILPGSLQSESEKLGFEV